MSLPVGASLGVFEISGALGRGGMGEVYRARDSRLNRDVALKVLPDAFASDPERLARFEREAQVLASLNHPHIAQIYGLEDEPVQLPAPTAEPGARVRALVLEVQLAHAAFAGAPPVGQQAISQRYRRLHPPECNPARLIPVSTDTAGLSDVLKVVAI